MSNEIRYFIDRTSNPEPLKEPEPTKDTTKEMDFSKIVELIKTKIKKGIKEYHFRPYCIDGVYCYIVLYLKQKMLTVESINVKCKFNDVHTMPYVLYHKKYKSIDKIVQLIYQITTTYKIVNGDLLALEHYNDMKIEETLIPYNEAETCCVCLENTTDNTTCGHFICLRCRDKCIIQQKKDCPMCRSKNVLPTYCNNLNLINNMDYSELYDLFYDKIYEKRNVNVEEEDDDEDEDGNSIVSSSSEEEEDVVEDLLIFQDDDVEEEQEEEEEEEQEQDRDEPLPPQPPFRTTYLLYPSIIVGDTTFINVEEEEIEEEIVDRWDNV